MSWAGTSHSLGKLVPQPARPVVRRELVRFRQRGLGPHDAVLVSYPKSGSTWLRFLLGHTLSGSEVDFDSVRRLIPPAGKQKGAGSLLPGGGRIIRTHEPLKVVSRRAGKVIYLVRDGRQVARSYYRHLQRIGLEPGSPGDYIARFLAGNLDYYGSWQDHVLGARAAQASGTGGPMAVRYEDLVADTAGVLRRVLEFLGSCPSPGEIDNAIEVNSRDGMRAKEARSKLLQRQNVDGSDFVGGGSEDFRDLFGEAAAADFERVAGPALQAFGYILGAGDPAGLRPLVP